MVLYILTGYWVLGIVCLDQLTGAHHTHTYLKVENIICSLLKNLLLDFCKLILKQKIIKNPRKRADTKSTPC